MEILMTEYGNKSFCLSTPTSWLLSEYADTLLTKIPR
jgi:hypothetical protein